MDGLDRESAPVIDAEQIAAVLEPVLVQARRQCRDNGLRAVPLVSRRKPHGIAVVFEFSTLDHWLDARDHGRWFAIRTQAERTLRQWLVARGERAYLTIEADVIRLPIQSPMTAGAHHAAR